MVARFYIFGHPVIWDEELNIFLWEDTKEPCSKRKKRCPQCGSLPTKEGHDPCLGEIPGAIGACCGHGVESGRILWDIDKNWHDDERSIFRKHIDIFLHFLKT